MSSKTGEELIRKLNELAENNKRLFEELQSNEDRLRSITRGAIRMQEDERARISRELHDGIGQSLTALKMNIHALQSKVVSEVSAPTQGLMREIEEQAGQCLEEVRELSLLLRPRMLDDLGLIPTLRWYTKNTERRSGIRVTLRVRGFRGRLNPETETWIFRIVQETVNNIVKHSRARNALVDMLREGEKVQLEISDDGIGFNPDLPSTGAGLGGIQERVALLNGTLLISSAPKKGTRYKIQFTMPPNSKRKKSKS
jgi:signal transduction histidine kinase